jgi:biotin carboxyl carrier protein
MSEAAHNVAPLPRKASADGTGGVAPDAADLLKLLFAVLGPRPLASGAHLLASRIASRLGYDRVLIGLLDPRHVRVIAVSDSTFFDDRLDVFQSACAAMDEAIEQACSVAFPSAASARPLITAANAALATRLDAAVLTIPLAVDGEAIGGLCVARRGRAIIGSQEIGWLEDVAALIAPLLALKRDSERRWHELLWLTVRKTLGELREPGRHRLTVGVTLTALALFPALFAPVEYQVSAPARVEGATQRVLVAPADGFLRQVYVKPGDAVTEGQLLAELDEEELLLQQRKWESEFAQYDNAAAAALSRGDRTQYSVNQARASEARAQADLIATQLARTRLVAPFPGMVIKGDLSQALGSPVQRGEVLLTLAPADRFRLVAEVDERDIERVREGAAGRLALGAFTGALPFKVVRITPVAGNREGRNFFAVEGELLEPSASLRAGLQGVAKVEAGHATPLWILTHRLGGRIRLILWQWGLIG